MNKEQLIEKLEETKERLDHYQAEGNTEYIDLCREEICEIEEAIAELEMNKDELKIECDNDLYKYDNADIYDYICTLREIICNDVLKEQKLKKQLDIANKNLDKINFLITKEHAIYGNIQINKFKMLEIIGGE